MQALREVERFIRQRTPRLCASDCPGEETGELYSNPVAEPDHRRSSLLGGVFRALGLLHHCRNCCRNLEATPVLRVLNSSRARKANSVEGATQISPFAFSTASGGSFGLASANTGLFRQSVASMLILRIDQPLSVFSKYATPKSSKLPDGSFSNNRGFSSPIQTRETRFGWGASKL
jgi:hypothetical protein